MLSLRLKVKDKAIVHFKIKPFCPDLLSLELSESLSSAEHDYGDECR